MTLANQIPSGLLSKIIDIYNFYQRFSKVDLSPQFIAFYDDYPDVVDGLSLQHNLQFRCLLKVKIRNFIVESCQ